MQADEGVQAKGVVDVEVFARDGAGGPYVVGGGRVLGLVVGRGQVVPSPVRAPGRHALHHVEPGREEGGPGWEGHGAGRAEPRDRDVEPVELQDDLG